VDNLNGLSLKELKDLQSQVAKAIASFEDRKKKEALADLEELTGAPVVRRRAPASAKYANPADKSDTWSGRGRKPRWFIAALAEGQQPEDLAI
jgi:DNA-binding protein H-NS